MKNLMKLRRSVVVSTMISVFVLIAVPLQSIGLAMNSNNDSEVGLQMPEQDRSEFLALAGSRNILAWIKYADTKREYPNTLEALSRYFSDYTLTESETTDPAVLASELTDKDVFLMPEPEGGSTSDLQSSGSAFGPVLDEFVNRGGVVIVLSEQYRREGFLSAAGLLNVTSFRDYYDDATGQVFTILLKSHPLVQGLSTPTIKGANATTEYTISNPDAQIVVVGPNNKGVIASRQIGAGYVILIGYDYFNFNNDAARILANAVNISDVLLTADPLFHDFGNVLLNPSPPPQQTVTVTNISTGSITIGDLVLKGANTGQFGILNDLCSGMVLDSDGSCTVDAFFKPTSVGEKNASLELPYLAGGETLNAHVILKGSGVLPTPPIHLSIRGRTGHTNYLAWKEEWPGVDQFKIYRKKGSNAWKLLATATAAAEAASYSDTTAFNNDTEEYSYYLKACEGAACSKPSDTIVVPAAPVSQPANIDAGTVVLGWTDASGNETLYRVWKKEGSCTDAEPWTMQYAEVGANVVTYTDADVISGKTYAYKIRALFKTAQKPYGIGRSRLSNCVEATLP